MWVHTGIHVQSIHSILCLMLHFDIDVNSCKQHLYKLIEDKWYIERCLPSHTCLQSQQHKGLLNHETYPNSYNIQSFTKLSVPHHVL